MGIANASTTKVPFKDIPFCDGFILNTPYNVVYLLFVCISNKQVFDTEIMRMLFNLRHALIC